MTGDSPSDWDITTAAAFNDALEELLVAAHANGVEVAGAWPCRNGGDVPDWEATVVELAPRETDAD